MVGVTVHEGETPSEAVIKAANATVTVKDERGREITVRRLKTLDRMRLLEMVGAENSLNDRYLGYATLAHCVVGIDGDPIPVCNSKVALEAVVQRLDDDGINAVASAVAANFMASKTADEVKDTIKNG
jgi:hypothetical protein